MTLKVVELFAGIGAWSKALNRLEVDYEVVEAVEFDEKTINSYNIIHNTKFEKKDITKIDCDKFPDHDILFYSPPCQAFSVAGRQEGFADPRGTLFFSAFEVIKSKRPQIAIMENVKGLTQKKFKNEFTSMLNMLEEEGYTNYWKVLNAKEYGIPQNRDRVFIVSIRNDISKSFEFPTGFDNGIRLKHLLEDEVDEKYYISQDKTEKLLKEYVKGLEKKDRLPSELSLNGESISYCIDASYAKGISPGSVNDGRRTHIVETLNTREGGNRQPKIVEQNELIFVGGFDTSTDKWIEDGKELSRNFKEGYRVYDSEGIACTQKSNGGGLGGKTGLYKVQYRIRKLTPLECFRLMGFEDEDYHKLKNNKISNSQIYKMAGNSIVVNVIEEILKELIPEYIIKQI
ncbi:Modification methylase HhaI [compost metagenome]